MILIAFGANLPSAAGSPQETYAALPALLGAHGVTVLAQSPLYRTAPVPASDQPDYMNGAMSVTCHASAEELLMILMRTEYDLGRRRSEINAARGIDLDLIAYHDEIIEGEDLTLPHPRMHHRRFVLEPLKDIAPDYIHPRIKRTVNALYLDLLADQEAA